MTRSPNQQQEQFFQWFSIMGVHSFDIQLRMPDPDSEFSRDGWRWLKPSLDVSIGSFFMKYANWTRFMNSKGGDVYVDRNHTVGRANGRR